MKHLLLLFLLGSFLLQPLRAADLSITSGSFLPSINAKSQIGVAGAAITIGQLLYFDAGTESWKLADANVAASSYVGGIAGSAAAVGQQVIVILEDPDLTLGATLDMSKTIYILSATAGGIADVADLAAGGMYPAVCIVATSTTKCAFRPFVRGSALSVAP